MSRGNWTAGLFIDRRGVGKGHTVSWKCDRECSACQGAPQALFV
jgi:hypothetical protein